MYNYWNYMCKNNTVNGVIIHNNSVNGSYFIIMNNDEIIDNNTDNS